MYGNQQQYSLGAPQHPMISINPMQPPYVPDVQPPPHVANLVYELCANLANEVQSKAQQNPARTFMFNVMAANNWYNADFDEMCKFAIGLLSAVWDGQPQRLYSVAADVAKTFMARMVMANQQMFAPVLPQDVMYAMTQAAGEYNGMLTVMNSALQQQRQPYGAQMHYPNQVGNYPANNVRQRPSIALGGNNTTFGRFNGVNPAPNGSAIAGRTDATQLSQRFSEMGNNRRWEKRLNQTVAQTDQGSDDEYEAVSLEDWKPSSEQPYLLVYNPHTHFTGFEKSGRGNIVQVINEWDSQMRSQSEHELPTGSPFGRDPRPVPAEETAVVLKNIQQGVKALVDGVDTGRTTATSEENNGVVVQRHKTTSVDFSLDVLFFTNLIHRASEDPTPDVFITTGTLVHPNLHTVSESDIINQLAECQNFGQLATSMELARDTISKSLYNLLNGLLVDLVNRMVRLNLGIPKLKITNFVEDYEPLMNVIEQKYNAGVVGAFQKNERVAINRLFGVVDPVEAMEARQALMGDYEHVNVELTMLFTRYSLTTLNCDAHQLQIALDSDTGALLTREHSNVLQRLAEAIYENTKDIDSYDRHFIRTNDGRVLELTRGFINTGSYLIRLVR